MLFPVTCVKLPLRITEIYGINRVFKGGIVLQLVTVDFDGTLFQGDSFKLMFTAGRKEFGIREWTTVLIGTVQALFLGIIKGKHALRIHFFKTFAKTFKGKTEKELAGFFDELIAAGRSQINEPLVHKIKEHQESGKQVIILSGALKPFLDALIDKLGLTVTTIGTELLFDQAGRCTGATGPVINGEEKVRAVNNWLEKRQLEPADIEIWAYADSESDIPLLHFVDKPIIVNPKDGMRKVAKTKQWPIFGEN